MKTLLRLRSYFSLHYGTSSIRDAVYAARENGFSSVAIADIDNLYGVHIFLKICREAGVKPVVGCEVKSGELSALLLAKNLNGFANISTVVSRKSLDADADLTELLLNFSESVIIMTENIELLEFLNGRTESLYAIISSPGSAVYLAAEKLGIQSVLAPEIIFREKSDIHIHRVLQSIERNALLGQNEDDEGESHLISQRSYQVLEELYPEAAAESEKIADLCSIEKIDYGFVFPKYPSGDPAALLRERVIFGAEKRYGEISEAVMARIDYELEIINYKNFASYFLTVADIVKENPRICGRGSGAASIVSYTLFITNVDPIRHNLYFERFLNPERTDPPDIDIDFAWDERDDVLSEIVKKYGEEHTAMVCTVAHFRFRSALREVARVYGLPDPEITDMEKNIRHHQQQHGKESLFGELSEKPWSDIMKDAGRITGFPRHLGVHPGGIVITPKPVERYVPVMMAPKGVRIITWDKDDSEDSGLVKIDILGNRSLGVIRDAIENMRENGVSHDELSWNPINDREVETLLAKGKSMGVFYIESPAMRQLQQKTKRGDFEHIIIHSSIIRPAANNLINEYVRRLRGEQYKALHPVLGKILSETYGLMCYQEDVSKVAVALAGFTPSEGDRLRKILSKKDREQKLRDYRKKFFDGALCRGVDEDVIEKIWEMILSFDGYSFCKPHSASYAMVSFQSAWIKRYYPAEFIAAVISNGGGFYSVQAYISEAKRMGLKVLPPDINLSSFKYSGSGDELRTGLMAVSGVRRKVVQEILEERERRGSFISLEDFKSRVYLKLADAEPLVYSGLFDSLDSLRSRGRRELNKPQKLWFLVRDGRGKHLKQGALFETEYGTETLPHIPPPSKIKLLEKQYDILGFLPEYHPLIFYRKYLKNHSYVKACEIVKYIGRVISVAGWFVTWKPVRTSDGKVMAFVTWEDETDIFESVMFSEVYRKFAPLIGSGPLLILGKVEDDQGALMVNIISLKRV